MRRSPLLIALAVSALAIAAPAAVGAEATGNTTLVLARGKAKVLKKRGIALRAGGASSTDGRETRLQVGGGTVGTDSARLRHRGNLRIVARQGGAKRVVRLKRLETRLGTRSVVTARFAGKRRVLFDLRPRRGHGPAFDGLRGVAALDGARLVWRGSAVRLLRKRLRAKVPFGRLGRAQSRAVATGTVIPTGGPITEATPRLARPATAVDVSAATVTWHVRSSWIGYLQTEAPKSGAAPIEGAIPGPAVPEAQHPCLDDGGGETDPLVYDYTFPFAEGWYDAASGSAAIYGTGGIHFRYPAHGIDLAVRNPEIEINGAASRVVMRARGSAGTPYQDTRTPLLTLALASPPGEGAPGSFGFPGVIRSALTGDGEAAFGGFYRAPSNHGFGCFSVSFQAAAK